MSATTNVTSAKEPNPYQELKNLWKEEVSIFNPETNLIEDIPFYQALNKVAGRISVYMKELETEFQKINGKKDVKNSSENETKTVKYSIELQSIKEFHEKVKKNCETFRKVLNTSNTEGINKYTGDRDKHAKRLQVMTGVLSKEFVPLTKGNAEHYKNYYEQIYQRDGKAVGWEKWVKWGLWGAPAVNSEEKK